MNAVAITFYVVGGMAAVAGGGWLGARMRQPLREAKSPP
jgi:hypothetical protein